MLSLGAALYPQRVKVLRREINALIADGTFGTLKYDASKGDFVD